MVMDDKRPEAYPMGFNIPNGYNVHMLEIDNINMKEC